MPGHVCKAGNRTSCNIIIAHCKFVNVAGLWPLFTASEEPATIKPTALSRLQLRFENGEPLFFTCNWRRIFALTGAAHDLFTKAYSGVARMCCPFPFHLPFPRTNYRSYYSVVFKPAHVWKIIVHCLVATRCNLLYFVSHGFYIKHLNFTEILQLLGTPSADPCWGFAPEPHWDLRISNRDIMIQDRHYAYLG